MKYTLVIFKREKERESNLLVRETQLPYFSVVTCKCNQSFTKLIYLSLSFFLRLCYFSIYLALLFVLMEVNSTIALAPANNHTKKHHHSLSSSQSHGHHHGIFSSISILILSISITFIVLFLVILLLIVLLRRLKSAKKNGTWKEHNDINNTSSRFIAHTTVNINSSPGD